MGGFAKLLGQCSAIMAELWSVFEGLKLTKMPVLRKVEINAISIEIVHAIEKERSKKDDGLNLIIQIQRLFENHETVVKTV